MKKFFKLLVFGLFLYLAPCVSGQTTVNLTVSDTPDAQTWNSGTWTAVLQMRPGSPPPTGGFVVVSGGGSVSSQRGSLSSSGTASISLPANANINPSQTQWALTVCPQATYSCYQSFVTVSTSSPQALTISPPSIRINYQNSTPPVVAYTDTEVVGASLGSVYYNTTSGTQRVCGLPLCTWSALSGSTGAPQVINVETSSYTGCCAVGDAQIDKTITWSGSGVNTTITATDSPFKSSDVGKIIFCGNTSTFTWKMAQTTIASYIDANNVKVATVAAASASNNVCAWGTQDDAAPINAAITAAMPNAANSGTEGGPWTALNPLPQTVYLPCGGYIIASARIQIYLATGGQIPNFEGQYSNCVYLLPSPSLPNYADGTGWLFRDLGTSNSVGGFTIYGLSGLGEGSAAIAFFQSTGLGKIHDLNCFQIGANAGEQGIYVISANEAIYNIRLQGCAGAGSLYLNGPANVDVYNALLSNGSGNLVVSGCSTPQLAGSAVTFHGGLIDEGGTTTASVITCPAGVRFLGTTIWGTTGATALAVDSTSNVYLNDATVVPYNNNNNVTALSIAGSGHVFATSTIFQGTGTGALVNAPSTASLVDEGGNTWLYGTSPAACTPSNYTTCFTGGIIPKASITHSAGNTCYAESLAGNLLATAQNLCNTLLDQHYQLLSIAAQSGGTTPANSSCATPPVITLSDGTRSATMTMTSGKTSWQSNVDSVTNINQVFASGALLTVSIGANTCATPPVNVSVTYVLQSVLNP